MSTTEMDLLKRRGWLLDYLYQDGAIDNIAFNELREVNMKIKNTLDIKPRAKSTAGGKIQLRLSGLQVPVVKEALERLIGELEIRTSAGRLPLSFRNAQDWTYKGLVAEMYTKHFRDLSLINKEIKITITVSQACALWHLQNEDFDSNTVNSPLLHSVYYDLHRVITNL